MRAGWIMTAVCCGLATLVAFPVAQADHDDDDDRGGGELVGTWRVTIPEFDAFAHVVFNKGNTLTEKNTLSGRISVSSGVWKKIRGRGNYATTLESFNDGVFMGDADGVFDTRAVVRQTIHVEGDTLTGTGIVDIFSVDGEDFLFSLGGGGTFTGTRMTVIRE